MAKVLLVDDDRAISIAMTVRLRANGYVVECASDACSAEAQAFVFVPDVIILDLNLPGKDGFELLTAAQSGSPLSGIPIILMSANNDPAIQSKAIELGAVGFLVKPYESIELTRLLEGVLKGASSKNVAREDSRKPQADLPADVPLSTCGTDKPLVLIVDDDFVVRRTIEFQLEAQGWRVACAVNGREGIGQLDAISPDVIILDVQMPVMTGVEVLHEIRNTRGQESPPIVMNSSSDMSTLRKEYGERNVMFHAKFEGGTQLTELVKEAVEENVLIK